MIKGLFIVSAEWFSHLYGPAEQADLSRSVEWVAPPQTAQSIQANLDLLWEVEVIFAGWGTAKMDHALLAAAPRLRAVFHAGGSIRYFAGDDFWNRGLTVASGAAINALPVAEYTLASILFSLRDGWYYQRAAFRDGAFPPPRPFAGAFNSIVGIVSLGMVGRLVCERLRPFDLKIIAYDPRTTRETADCVNAELVSLEEVFTRSEVVSVHAPLLPETEQLIRGHHFHALKPGATFINTSRGAVVHEREMIDALRTRTDIQAVLDVTSPEPPHPQSPLYTLPNVMLTPHIAATNAKESRRIGQAMVAEFHRWSLGQPLLYQITREQANHLA